MNCRFDLIQLESMKTDFIKLAPVSRRSFVKATGLVTTSLYIYGVTGCSSEASQRFDGEDLTSPWLYLSVEGDRFNLILPRSEMGQDVATSFTVIVAEEMDFPVERFRIQFADANSALGAQLTVGSASVRLWWIRLRQIGATMRAMVLDYAAQHFSVRQNECVIQDGIVKHLNSNQEIDYLDLLRNDVPSAYRGPVTLKTPSEFKVIGAERNSLFVKEKVTGSFNYAADLKDAGTVFAGVAVFKSDWAFPDDSSLENLKQKFNLLDIFRLDGNLDGFNTRVVMLSKATWPIIQCKRALAQQWPQFSEIKKESSFNRESEKQKSEKQSAITQDRLSLSFRTPPVAHAPMEPETAIVEVDNDYYQVWAPTQAPQRGRDKIAEWLKVSTNNITLHTVPLGGSFGRKRYNDFLVETAWIAQRFYQRQHEKGVPGKVKIQLLWMREDDLAREHYRCASVQSLTWSITAKNYIEHSLCESASPGSVESLATGHWFEYLGFDVGSTRKRLPGDFSPGIFRSVEHGYLGFAMGSFLDELSYCHEEDPLQFYAKHIAELSIKERVKVALKPRTRYQSDRLLNVIEQVRQMSGWSAARTNAFTGFGFTAYRCFSSYIALVVEVEVNNDNLIIKQVWAAVDCGQAVHPNGIKAQIEGGILYGLSACLFSEIPVEKERQQLNFYNYEVARMKDTPVINVEVVESALEPSGVGELGVPVIAPALANAIRQATHLRFLQMPFLKAGKLNRDYTVEGWSM